ncbi:MAG TPA: hypothetical protein VGC49_01085 [Solirubrobacterales bacterium]
MIALAIAQVFLGVANDRQFLGFAIWRLGHLFPYLPQQPGYNKRLRALAPQIARAINYLAYVSPSIFDGLRLLDSTPLPCGASSSRGPPPTAIAEAIRASSGAFASICSAPPTAPTGWSATAPAPCPGSSRGSGCDCSPCRPGSGITASWASPAGTSPPRH